MLDVPDLWSFVDAGSKEPSLVSRDTSDQRVSVSEVDSEPELGDKLRLPDFSSDIDPGPGNPYRSPGVLIISAGLVFLSAFEPGPERPSPESGGIPDQPHFVSDFDLGFRRLVPESG